jgi:hypothetical protein
LKLAPSVIEVIVADEWDERLDTVTRTFLGLTVACARCHDHKFDPVTTRDYYALAGVFASTQVADRPLLPSPLAEQVAEAKGKLDKLQESLKKQKDKDSDEAKKLQQQIDELRAATPQIDSPLAPVVEDSSVYVVADGPDATKLEYRKRQPRDLPVFRRGNPAVPGEVVPRRFLELFAAVNSGGDGTDGTDKTDGNQGTDGNPQDRVGGVGAGLEAKQANAQDRVRLEPFHHGSGRLELANALVNQARGLTARVIVNRIWSHHFGKGLVRTPGDFGHQGERPSHPELLEWLAGEVLSVQFSVFSEDTPVSAFRKETPEVVRPIEATDPLTEHRTLNTENSSLKRLHRLMVTSATYRRQSSSQPSAVSDQRSADPDPRPSADPDPRPSADPDNVLLSRMNRRRLEIEPWRDAMLAVAGNLDDRMEGAGAELAQPSHRRRTLYGLIGRDEQNDMLRIYDFPPPTTHSPSRDATTTPLQQLFVLNSDFVERQAAVLASRLLEPAGVSVPDRIDRCYQLLFQRPPHPGERKLGEQFLSAAGDGNASEVDRWHWYVQSLLGLNEFLFVD